MKILRYAMTVIALALASGLSAQWTPTKAVFDVQKPTMKVFLPKDDLNTGRAVVACPGGSYLGHAIAHEGWDWAPFFNKQGIALIVLQYTLPAGDRTKPIADAEAAIKMAHRPGPGGHHGLVGWRTSGIDHRHAQHCARRKARFPNPLLPCHIDGPQEGPSTDT